MTFKPSHMTYKPCHMTYKPCSFLFITFQKNGHNPLLIGKILACLFIIPFFTLLIKAELIMSSVVINKTSIFSFFIQLINLLSSQLFTLMNSILFLLLKFINEVGKFLITLINFVINENNISKKKFLNLSVLKYHKYKLIEEKFFIFFLSVLDL